MSPTPPTLNPSQTVERIREIIVGRHLERLEGRVARLEKMPAVSAQPTLSIPIFEDRLVINEAKVEAMQDHILRIEGIRDEAAGLLSIQREEAQRLAAQIQETLREKSNSAAIPAIEKLEQRLGVWLGDWQKSLHVRLDDRDRTLTDKIKTDFSEMREIIEKRFSDLESRIPQNVEERFNKIAAAARALAESAATFSTPVPPKV